MDLIHNTKAPRWGFVTGSVVGSQHSSSLVCALLLACSNIIFFCVFCGWGGRGGEAGQKLCALNLGFEI